MPRTRCSNPTVEPLPRRRRCHCHWHCRPNPRHSHARVCRRDRRGQALPHRRSRASQRKQRVAEDVSIVPAMPCSAGFCAAAAGAESAAACSFDADEAAVSEAMACAVSSAAARLDCRLPPIGGELPEPLPAVPCVLALPVAASIRLGAAIVGFDAGRVGRGAGNIGGSWAGLRRRGRLREGRCGACGLCRCG